VPSLVIQSDADTGVFPSDAQAIFAGLGAEDKLLEMISGDHYLQEPSDARDSVADRIAHWLSVHL
jgi:alpha-beta hydrolase superfamily lysophospholipase